MAREQIRKPLMAKQQIGLTGPSYNVSWDAENKDGVWEKGIYRVNAEGVTFNPDSAKQTVAEILWSRGFKGDYEIIVGTIT